MANTLYGGSLRVPNIRNNYPKLNRPRRAFGSMGKRFTIRLNPRIKDYSYKLLMGMMLAGLFIIMLPFLMGCRFEVIQSGSMSPAIDTGSLVITRPVNPYLVEIGDVITFYSPANPDTMVVHRVAGIDNGAPLSFLTKGDANNTLDPYKVPAESVVGQVRFNVPWIGSLVGFMQSPAGFITFLAVPGAIILYLELNNLWTLLSLKKTTGQKRRKSLSNYNWPAGYKSLNRSILK